MSVVAGSTIQVPCYFSPSSQVKANALWLKENESGQSTLLNQKEGSEGGADRWEVLYPDDHDQTMIFRDVVMDDAGNYTCVSPEGQKLSSVSLTVKRRCSNLHHLCIINEYMNSCHHVSPPPLTVVLKCMHPLLTLCLTVFQLLLLLLLTPAPASPQRGSPARRTALAQPSCFCRSLWQSFPSSYTHTSESWIRQPTTCSSLPSVLAACCPICC